MHPAAIGKSSESDRQQPESGENLSTDLTSYFASLAADCDVAPSSAEIFAKVLTLNDDAGKHGVLIPNEAYSFFPALPIPDPERNATVLFPSIDAMMRAPRVLGWKYYERYPERRVTRLNQTLNDRSHGRRLLVVASYVDHFGKRHYVVEARVEGVHAQFEATLSLLFDASVPTTPGTFVRLPVEGPRFTRDKSLDELLGHFDRINDMGWVDSLRSGDTGIGYTFETLAGIKENNDKRADFKGIEIKCKLHRAGIASGKINLFQQSPTWSNKLHAIDRLKQIGLRRPNGLYACYSQVTTTPNNLGLRIDVDPPPGNLNLRKQATDIGLWTRDTLAKRLAEKHSRAFFVKAETRKIPGNVQYHYVDVVYCARPNIDRFVDMVCERKLVFEFTMHETASGGVRNHGYPWRLNDESLFDQLYALQVQLRGEAK